MAQGQRLERGAHLRRLPYARRVEGRDAHSAPRRAHCEAARFEAPEGLPHRHVARAELRRHMVLAQLLAWRQLARDDAPSERLGDVRDESETSLARWTCVPASTLPIGSLHDFIDNL